MLPSAQVMSRDLYAHVPVHLPICMLSSVNLGANNAAGLGSIATGSFGTCTNSASEIFFNDTPMTLARYPNVLPNGSWAWLSIDSVRCSHATMCLHAPAAQHSNRFFVVFRASRPSRSPAASLSTSRTLKTELSTGTPRRRGCTDTGSLTGTLHLRSSRHQCAPQPLARSSI